MIGHPTAQLPHDPLQRSSPLTRPAERRPRASSSATHLDTGHRSTPNDTPRNGVQQTTDATPVEPRADSGTHGAAGLARRGTPHPDAVDPRQNHPSGEPIYRCARRPNEDHAWGTTPGFTYSPRVTKPPCASTGAQSRQPESHARGPRATTRNATSRTPSRPGRARATAAWRRPV